MWPLISGARYILFFSFLLSSLIHPLFLVFFFSPQFWVSRKGWGLNRVGDLMSSIQLMYGRLDDIDQVYWGGVGGHKDVVIWEAQQVGYGFWGSQLCGR